MFSILSGLRLMYSRASPERHGIAGGGEIIKSLPVPAEEKARWIVERSEGAAQEFPCTRIYGYDHWHAFASDWSLYISIYICISVYCTKKVVTDNPSKAADHHPWG